MPVGIADQYTCLNACRHACTATVHSVAAGRDARRYGTRWTRMQHAAVLGERTGVQAHRGSLGGGPRPSPEFALASRHPTLHHRCPNLAQAGFGAPGTRGMAGMSTRWRTQVGRCVNDKPEASASDVFRCVNRCDVLRTPQTLALLSLTPIPYNADR